MTNKEYQEHPGISRSSLFLIGKSPLHYKYAQEHPTESSPALEFGSAAHKFILENDSFNGEYAIAPIVDRRTKEGKARYAEFVENAAGKSVISQDDLNTIIDMRTAIIDSKIASRFLYAEGAKYEQSFFWTDALTGEAVKCRPDCMCEVDGKKYIVDYKTTDSCEDGHFERSCRKYGYKLQAGMYREGVFQNTLDDYGFIFVAQEKKAPYAVRVYICNEDFISEGYDQYRELLGIYHECKQSGIWYGYEGPTGDYTDLTGEGDRDA